MVVKRVGQEVTEDVEGDSLQGWSGMPFHRYSHRFLDPCIRCDNQHCDASGLHVHFVLSVTQDKDKKGGRHNPTRKFPCIKTEVT